MSFKKIGSIVVFINIFISSFPLFAQTPQQLQTVLGPNEPGKVGEALAPKPVTEQIPSLAPGLLQIPGAQQFSGETAKIQFTLHSLKIKDAVVFSCDELLEPFLHCLCKTITLGDLQEIAREMTTKYQQAGYVLTQVIIPEQEIRSGNVTLQVVSGFIDKVHIQGCYTEEQEAVLREYGRRILACRPMQQKILERYTLIANDTPGMKVDAVLKRSETPMAADLVFVIQPKRDLSYIAVNNYGTRFLGPRQYVAGTGVNSLFQSGDDTTVQMVTTANEELNFAQIRHTIPIGCEGMVFGALGRFVRTEPGSILEQFYSKGKSRTAGIDLLYPVIRSRSRDVFVQGGFVVTDSKSDLLGAPLYADRIRPVFGSVAVNQQDTLFTLTALNHLDLILTQGLKILRASGNTNISRPGGKSQFTKLNFTASRQQMLPKTFSLFLLMSGQYSFQRLLAISQFGYGGPELGRGYDPAELLGDYGLAGTVELRYDVERTCLWQIPKAQWYAFYDAGIVWHTDPFIARQSATSTGLGIRMEVFEWGRAHFFTAKPLTRKVLALNNKHWRVFFAFTVLIP